MNEEEQMFNVLHNIRIHFRVERLFQLLDLLIPNTYLSKNR